MWQVSNIYPTVHNFIPKSAAMYYTVWMRGVSMTQIGHGSATLVRGGKFHPKA